MKQEQIDEIYECIKYNTGSYDDDARSCAEILYNYLGYRKSEWVSVEDGLPEKSGACIVCRFNGYVYKTFFSGTFPKAITHWMPSPHRPQKRRIDYE